MKKFVTFAFLIVFTIALFVWVLIKTPILSERVHPEFSPVYNFMNVILETQNAKADDVILYADGSFYEIPPSVGVLNKTLSGKVNEIKILISDEFKNKIKSIVIFNDLKVHYFKNFDNFEKERFLVCPDSKCRSYSVYIPPDSIKYNPHSKSLNFHSIQNTICNLVLAPISGNRAFYIPYLALFLTIIFYIKSGMNIKIKGIYFAPLILIFALLTYSNGMFDYLPWPDEYRTIEYSDTSKPLIHLFTDPGNPFLFYFLFRIFISFFGVSIYSMKTFPFIFSVLMIAGLWLVLKNKFDIKTANIGVFLAAVNVPLIYYCQETRSYIMQAFLSPLIIYFFTEILQNPKKKFYVIYAILGALAANTHYYMILLLGANYIFALVYFCIKKRYKDILYFTITNAISALFFLPFFFMTALNKALLDSRFNDWIPKTDYKQVKKCVFYIFGGGASLFLSIFFFIKNCFNNRDKNRSLMLCVLFNAMVLVIVFAVVLSLIVRPMLVERYLVLLSPLFMMYLAVTFTMPYKSKYMVILFIIWVLLLQAGSFEKNNRKKGIIELPYEITKQYYNQTKNEHLYAVVNLSNPEYLNDERITKHIFYFQTPTSRLDYVIYNIKKEDPNAIIFTNLVRKKDLLGKDKYKCFFNTTTDLCLWKVE